MLAAALETRWRIREREARHVSAARAVCDVVHDVRWVVDTVYSGRLSVDFEDRSIRLKSPISGRQADLLTLEADATAFPLHVLYRDDCADEAELRACVVSIFSDRLVMDRIEALLSSSPGLIASKSVSFEGAMSLFINGEERRRAHGQALLVAPFAAAAAEDLDRISSERSEGRVHVVLDRGRIEFHSELATTLLADLSSEETFPVVVGGETVGNGEGLYKALRRIFVQHLEDGKFESFLREAKNPSF
jgi:hypothetical protein